ncbi:MAG TPA: DUF1015 domain-containing protein [Clostridiales bacterium]|nr:DUF1015 domain-containing protein [Clostridiales bacterium]
MKTIRSCDILVPDNCDHQKWSVVACDQFTSERGYWKKLEDFVGDANSTLKLIFPEAYLEDSDKDERIDNINRTMKEYLDGGVFKTLKDSFIVCKRTTASGISRLGIVLAVDLEDYCFTHPSNAYIRSTEGVVLDRIPPRLKIRQDAPVELPHIMLLIDDRKHSVIEPIWAAREGLEKVYDFDLNMGGGHLEGYRIDSQIVIDAFEKYVDSVQNLYGTGKNDFIFAVGDGNHSLATAQAHWNRIKEGLTDAEKAVHPARFALCEVENLHDDGIVFEPIHRFVFGVGEDFIRYMQANLSGEKEVKAFDKNGEYVLRVDRIGAKAIKDIQSAIDEYLKAHGGTVDYIHGIEHLKDVASRNDGVAIAMPKIEKEELFDYVLKNGTLCRKAFSMGEAEEKRYYFEAKKIK